MAQSLNYLRLHHCFRVRGRGDSDGRGLRGPALPHRHQQQGGGQQGQTEAGPLVQEHVRHSFLHVGTLIIMFVLFANLSPL